MAQYQDVNDSPVLFYDWQGSTTIDIKHGASEMLLQNYRCNDKNFLFGFMDNDQCNTMQRYRSGDMSVICVDSTHGTNGYDFHLATIMVLDVIRQGSPVAFLYSNLEMAWFEITWYILIAHVALAFSASAWIIN